MDRIASFSVDHDLIEPGIYISRIDGDIVTYDLRTRKPNAGDYMDNLTMHTVEHMLATFLRNSERSYISVRWDAGRGFICLSAAADRRRCSLR